MNVLTFDVETTHIQKETGGTTALPYFGNRLVSIGYVVQYPFVRGSCYDVVVRIIIGEALNDVLAFDLKEDMVGCQWSHWFLGYDATRSR